jgi:hypothetical protein
LSLPLYLWLHLAGIGLTLMALGAVALQHEDWRKTLSIAHGVGMLVVLVGGFGLLAKLALPMPWPGWVYGKLVLWLVLGAAPTLMKRLPHLAKPLWWATWVLFLLAAYLAVLKPF